MISEEGGTGNRILGYLPIVALEAVARGAITLVYVAHLLLPKNGDETGAESIGFENEAVIVTMSNARSAGCRQHPS